MESALYTIAFSVMGLPGGRAEMESRRERIKRHNRRLDRVLHKALYFHCHLSTDHERQQVSSPDHRYEIAGNPGQPNKGLNHEKKEWVAVHEEPPPTLTNRKQEYQRTLPQGQG